MGKTMQFSSYILDEFLSTKLSQLNHCDAPYVEKLPNYISALRFNQSLSTIKYKNNVWIFIFSFIIKLSESIYEYRQGRESLLEYVASLPSHKKLHAQERALMHFENSILRLNISILSLNGLLKSLGLSNPAFAAGDRSDYDRVRRISNRIKHFDEDVERAVERGTPIPLKAVWLTNDGLESTDGSITFTEIAAIFQAQAEDARQFAEEVPRKAMERNLRPSSPPV